MLLALFLMAGAVQAELRPAFRIRVGNPPGPSAPVFTEGRAFFVDAAGRALAIDTGSGRRVWEALVRCGADALALRAGRLVCVEGRHGRVRVLDAQSGKLLFHDSLSGGPFAASLVGEELVLADLTSGRHLGFDVKRLTWSFDYRTAADIPRDGAYTTLMLGDRYFFTQDGWRTLWAIDTVRDELRVVARSDTPVRIDEGRSARITHGVILSHDAHTVAAFELAHARRTWRVDLRKLFRSRRARVGRVAVAAGEVAVLVETATAPTPEGGTPGRTLSVIILSLRTGELRASATLTPGLPALVRPRIALPMPDHCAALRVTGMALVHGQPVLALGSACDANKTRLPLGFVVGIDRNKETVAWVTPPRTADRLVDTPQAIYGLWGGPGIPHADRAVVELDPATGHPRAHITVGYSPSWALLHEDQLWVGTTAGAVIVLRR